MLAVDGVESGYGRTTVLFGVSMEVPDDALYGIQTLRATENFPITGVPIRDFPALIEALAAVKEAAARANAELGLMKPELADTIARVARELRDGRHHEQFVVVIDLTKSSKTVGERRRRPAPSRAIHENSGSSLIEA